MKMNLERAYLFEIPVESKIHFHECNANQKAGG